MKLYIIKIVIFTLVVILNTLNPSGFLYSQDLIITKSNDTIKCKIIDDNISFIKYQQIGDTTTKIIGVTEYNFFVREQVLQDKLKNLYERKISDIKMKFPINLRPLKKGVYANFDEFINNSPSYNFDFIILKRSRGSIAFLGGNEYKIKPIDEHIQSFEMNDYYWGVCDGENCYINCLSFSGIQNYSLLKLENTYAMFNAKPPNQDIDSGARKLNYSGNGSALLLLFVLIEGLERFKYKLDFHTGFIILEE